MRILFLTPYLPSFRAGGEKFTKLLLEDLSRTHQIDLLYYKYNQDAFYVPPNANVRVIKVCRNSLFIKLWNTLKTPLFFPTFTIRFSFLVLFFLKKQVREKRYDLIYLDHSQMLLYGTFFPDIPKMLMSHDVMIQRYGRQESFKKKWVHFSEKWLMSMHRLTIWTFSDKDQSLIKQVYGLESRVTTFYLDDVILNARSETVSDTYVFFGKWKRPDNFDGMKWFFDQVYSQLPKTFDFVVIGIGMPLKYQEYLNSLPNVKCLGFVDDPYPIIAGARALISPIFSGAGVKVKVVETLACGTPVVGNELAFEGISSDFYDFMMRAELPEQYAAILSSLNFSMEARRRFREAFVSRYGKSSIVTYLEGLER